jgi:hypothetical protein
MFTKDEILGGVKDLARTGDLQKGELMAAFDEAAGEADAAKPESASGFGRRLNLAQVLYYVGGGIVVLGIGILIAQNWSALNDFTRILSTLGSGVLAYVVAVLLGREERTRAVSSAFHLIAALVIPIGLFATLKITGYDLSTFGTQNLVFGILLAMYVASFLVFRQSIFVLFGIVFGSLLYFSLTSMIGENGSGLFGNKFDQYRFMVLGISYLLIGYGLRDTRYKELTGPAYFFGLPMTLLMAFILGDFKPSANLFWELIFPFLTFGAIVASIWLRSRSFLVWGTIFLMGYIFKITGEYFASDLGWPLALVIAGFAVIGIGVAAVNVRQKFWRRKAE